MAHLATTRLHLRLRRGYTLLEMLIVIGVIMLLMGILTAVLLHVRERMRITAAHVLVHKVQSAITQYTQVYRNFPPTTAGTLSGDQALYYYLGTTFTDHPVAANGEQYSDLVCPATKFEPREVRPAPSGGVDIIDPWSMPLVYRLEVQTDAAGIKTYMPVVYSPGLNKIDDGGLPHTDDVTINN